MNITIHHLLPISLLLTILPFFKDIAWPILVLNIFVLIWYMISRQLFYVQLFKQLRTKPLFKFVLVIINLALIVKIYGLHMTQTISIVLLISMLCLKLLEISSDQDKRNIAIILYLQFFLLACIFLSSQGILISLYSIFLVLLLSFLMLIFARYPLPLNISLSNSFIERNSTRHNKLSQLVNINFIDSNANDCSHICIISTYSWTFVDFTQFI